MISLTQSEIAKTYPAYTNVRFTNTIESVQYNAALAITGLLKKNCIQNWV